MTMKTTSESLRRRRWAAPLVGLALLVGLLAVPAGAQPTSSDPAQAADAGATWLTGALTGGGGAYVPGATGDPNISFTLQVGLALAATGTHEDAVLRIVDWFATSFATDGLDAPADLSAGGVGSLMILLDAVDRDPRSFGGHDLVAAVEATLGLHTPGLYGASDPTYDGVYRQSTAIMGLVAAGATPAPEAVAWLVDQQCDAATPEAEGGWEAYRADPSAPCAVPDAAMWSGADTNQTALAVQALAALGRTPDFDALAFLDDAQLPGGGFPYYPGGTDGDPNSEAVVVQAIVAAGEDPAAGRWAEAGGSALSALLAWQIGCGQEDAGAFSSPYSDGAPDLLASLQAVAAASLRSYPLGTVTFGQAADPCDPDGPTTTTTAGGGTSTTVAGGGAGTPSATPTGAAPAAVPVSATPRYTG